MTEDFSGALEAAKFEAAGENKFKFKAAKVGSKVKGTDGKERSWTVESLKGSMGTWPATKVSINHNQQNYGTIEADEFDGTFLYHTFTVQPWLAGWIRRNPNHIGVSIEANGSWDEQNNIVSAKGTGVTIVLPPYVPVCSLEEGCGYFAGATDKELSTADKPAEKRTGEKMDKTEDMIAAEVALKAEIKALNDKLVAAEASYKTIEAEAVELRAFKAKVDEKERGELLAALTTYLGDVEAYKTEHTCVLRKMVASCETAVKKMEAAQTKTSGADAAKNDEAKKNDDIYAGYAPEDVAELKAAEKIAASVGIKL